MRRLLPFVAVILATLAATPAAAWDRYGDRGGYGWRPAPSWHHPHRHPGWHRPWRHDHAWRGGWREDRRHHARRHYGRDEGWGYRRGW
jgi:hypothetical protein